MLDKRFFEVGCEGLSVGKPPDPCVMVIFGASGDLATRELIPSLYALGCKNLLPRSFAIVGFARTEWDDDRFRENMYKSVKKEAEHFHKEIWDSFAKRLYYVSGDIEAEPSSAYAELRKKIARARNEYDIPDNILYHFSTAPRFYSTIVKKMHSISLLQSENGWRRVIIEKPFGENEQSARELDQKLRSVLDEKQIYRVDHYLGKETVQNMLVFRFANPGFEPIWNRNYIDHVQITVAEDKGIGKRAGFYEQTGIIRDMVQNHLLQLLCMTAIEPPVNYDADSLRTETVKVLKSICEIDIEKDCVLGQYDAGEIDGENVKAYREGEKVANDSMVPTFAALKLTLDNWRWAHVPFYLRTGKRLQRKLTEVTIKFKPTPHLMFPSGNDTASRKNVLTFQLQPNEGIIYTFFAKQPGPDLKLQPVKMNFQYDETFGVDEPPGAYQWLLLDAMQGEQTLFPRADWIYEAWSIVDPIIKKWESEPWLEFPNYRAGSWGPEATDKLIRRDGRYWYIAK